MKCQAGFYFFLYTCGELVYSIAGVKIMPTEKPRYTITLDEEMLKKIDDFRFENRFANRTQATLELIRIGLETLEKQQTPYKAHTSNEGNTTSPKEQ